MRESIDMEKIYKQFSLNNNRYQTSTIYTSRATHNVEGIQKERIYLKKKKLRLMPQYGSTSADTLAKDTYTCVQYRRLKHAFAPQFLFPLVSA